MTLEEKITGMLDKHKISYEILRKLFNFGLSRLHI